MEESGSVSAKALARKVDWSEKHLEAKLELNWDPAIFNKNSKRAMMESVNISESESGMGVSANLPPKSNKCSSGAVILAMICVLSIMINLRVCHLSLFPRRRRPRSVAILVAHLSFLSIGITVVQWSYLMEVCWDVISVWNGICELSSFFRNTAFGIFPWNVVAIISKSNDASQNNYATTSLIGKLWLFAGLLNIPTIFMVRNEEDPMAPPRRKCTQITLFGDYTATVTFELMRFFAYHVLVVVYLMHEVFVIRSKLRYLHIRDPLPSDRMRRLLQRVRSVCIHCVLFTFLWLPCGVVLSLYKILRRRGPANSLNSWVKMMVLANSAFFMTVPTIYIFLNENISLLHFLVGRRLHRMLECGWGWGWPFQREIVEQPTLREISALPREERCKIVRRHSTCEALSHADFQSRHEKQQR